MKTKLLFLPSELASYHFCQVIYFDYGKDWFHIGNMKYRSNNEYFVRSSRDPIKKANDSRLKTTALKFGHSCDK